MHVPVPRPDPIEITDYRDREDFSALARTLAQQGGVTLVYAPSTTKITNTTHSASPAPVEVRVASPAGPIATKPQCSPRPCARDTHWARSSRTAAPR